MNVISSQMLLLILTTLAIDFSEQPPTNKCTCKINYTGHPSKLICELAASYCGRPQMSAVWKRKETFEVLGEGNYILINSSFQDNEIFCCLEGTAMKCIDHPRQFCTSVSIPHGDDEKPYRGRNNTRQTDSVTTLAPHHHDTESTNFHNLQPYIVVSCTVSSLVAIIALVVSIITCRKRKNNKNVADKREKPVQSLKTKEIKTNTAKQMEETCPLLGENWKQHAPVKIHDREHERIEATTEHESSTSSENIQNLRHHNFCKICSDNSADVVFRPCNHIVVCDNCSASLQECPDCRVVITDKMDIFLT